MPPARFAFPHLLYSLVSLSPVVVLSEVACYPGLIGVVALSAGKFIVAVYHLQEHSQSHPTQASTVCVPSGDRTLALEMYRKLLSVLPKDDKSSAGLKERLRRGAEARIEELSRYMSVPFRTLNQSENLRQYWF